MITSIGSQLNEALPQKNINKPHIINSRLSHACEVLNANLEYWMPSFRYVRDQHTAKKKLLKIK